MISLNHTNDQDDNSCITMKVMLYLCHLLTDTGLNENSFIIPTNKIYDELRICNVLFFEKSLKYLSSITYEYKYLNNWYSTNIIKTWEHKKGYFKVVFDDDFIILLSRTRQFYNIPKTLLKIDIRYYKHSLFLGNYLYLHKRRNKGKKNENIISVKELIKNCPLLPKYEELDKIQRQVDRNIIKPFQLNLNHLSRILNIEWLYIDSEPKNYMEFIDSKIMFKM